MKKYILSILAAGVMMSCNQQNQTTGVAEKKVAATANAANAPIMKFEEELFDFGKVPEGEKVTHEFKFTNTGKSPLIITDARASCGCTTPEWPHGPVKPGESGVIKVTFNSAGRGGLQDKQITITGNTNPAQTMVHLLGEVTEKTK